MSKDCEEKVERKKLREFLSWFGKILNNCLSEMGNFLLSSR